MFDGISDFADGERRAAVRRVCNAQAVCQVTNLLDQTPIEAGPWNASIGGICVVLETHPPTGTRLVIELRNPTGDRQLLTFGEVVYTILLPSAREMWLSGFEFEGDPLPEEDLQPFC
jgi:hypothetical protein